MKTSSKFAKCATSWNLAINTEPQHCWNCSTPSAPYARRQPRTTRRALAISSAYGNSIRRSGEICNDRRNQVYQSEEEMVENRSQRRAENCHYGLADSRFPWL